MAPSRRRQRGAESAGYTHGWHHAGATRMSDAHAGTASSPEQNWLSTAAVLPESRTTALPSRVGAVDVSSSSPESCQPSASLARGHVAVPPAGPERHISQQSTRPPAGADDLPTSKRLRSDRWVLTEDLEAGACTSSSGNGVFARVDLPASWGWREHPVCVPDCDEGGSRGARRLPSLHSADALMEEVWHRATAGAVEFERLLRGPWAMSFLLRHVELQDTGPNDLPEWAHKHGVSACEYNRLAAQLQSNVARVEADGVEGLVLNPRLRLCNHSCDANAELGWASDDPFDCACRTGQFEIRALRAIRAGEEVRYSYIGTPGVHAPLDVTERRALLERRWGFSCECDLCTEQCSS